MRRSVGLLYLLGATACGGRVDDPDPTSSSTSPAATANVASPNDGCSRACVHLAACVPTNDPRATGTCVTACQHDFDASHAARFGDCIEALSCQTVIAGVAMNYGPIGLCYDRARQ